MIKDIGKPKQIKNFYNREWGRVENKVDIENARRLFDQIGLTETSLLNKRVLDGGCETGAYSVVMAKYFRSHVTAVDIEPSCVEIAKRLAKQNQITIEAQQGDLTDLPFLRETFDTIVSLGVIHHTGKSKECLHSFHRILKPGGEIFISVQRACFAVSVKRLANITFRRIPETIRPLIYYPFYSAAFAANLIFSERIRFTPLSAGVRDALLHEYCEVKNDEGWCRVLEKSGFSNVRHVKTFGVYGSQGLYSGRKRDA